MAILKRSTIYERVIIDVLDGPDNALFKNQRKITGQTGNDRTKDVQIVLLLRYLSNFGELLNVIN